MNSGGSGTDQARQLQVRKGLLGMWMGVTSHPPSRRVRHCQWQDSEVTLSFLFHLYFIPPTMAIGTRKSNANVRPGRIVLENSRRRRTRKQIEEDNARANAAAVAEREEEEGRNKRIAELEDGIERDEEQVRTHANRPDLRYQPTRGSTEEEGDIPADSNKDFE